jgi:outer membrane receptor for ferric coprogen and ferric-rhodotorulic acid
MIDYYQLNTSPVYSSTGTVINFKPIKPENSSSYEFGYKGLINKRLLIDAYVYFATYNDFITTASGLQVATGKGFSVAQNANGTVNTNGWGASLEYLLPGNYSVSANLYSDQISSQPSDPNFVSYFNTPKTRLNLGFSNSGLKCNPRIGFNVAYRYQTSFNYEGTFVVGQVPSVGVVDGMISYKLPNIKSLVKVGATDVFNRYYVNGFGNAQVGGIYYVSFAYNVF